MKLNKNQLALIFDAIDCYEGYGDYTSQDGKYHLTEDEVDELITMISEELK
jgi:hypothetical protein